MAKMNISRHITKFCEKNKNTSDQYCNQRRTNKQFSSSSKFVSWVSLLLQGRRQTGSPSLDAPAIPTRESWTHRDFQGRRRPNLTKLTNQVKFQLLSVDLLSAHAQRVTLANPKWCLTVELPPIHVTTPLPFEISTVKVFTPRRSNFQTFKIKI